MNWGEIQIEALKKMFLNNEQLVVNQLNIYKEDKKYKTYLYAMPQACNEALNYILENAKPKIKEYKLKRKNIDDKYNLEQSIPNFKRLYQIVYDGKEKPNFYVEGNNVLVVKNWIEKSERMIIYYECYHDLISSKTPNTATIDIDTYLLPLIPLYIAAELYKDDDVQLSTMYMNEFLSNISNITGKDFNPNPTEINSVYEVEW